MKKIGDARFGDEFHHNESNVMQFRAAGFEIG